MVKYAVELKLKPAGKSQLVTDAMIDAAKTRGDEAQKNEPRAASVRFDKRTHTIIVTFTNGSAFSFPPDLAQGLAGATDKQLSEVRVLGRGAGLHWKALDTDLSVPSLVDQIFGTRKFMAQRGGQVKSAAKAAAARSNGQKGGRPRKTPAVHQAAAK